MCSKNIWAGAVEKYLNWQQLGRYQPMRSPGWPARPRPAPANGVTTDTVADNDWGDIGVQMALPPHHKYLLYTA